MIDMLALYISSVSFPFLDQLSKPHLFAYDLNFLSGTSHPSPNLLLQTSEITMLSSLFLAAFATLSALLVNTTPVSVDIPMSMAERNAPDDSGVCTFQDTSRPSD